MNIHQLEGRNGGKDWPMIVMAVPCPLCGAAPGEMCRTMKTPNPFMVQNVPRNDWHAERKYFAAQAWYAGREEGLAEKDIAPMIAKQTVAFSINEQSQLATAPVEQIAVVSVQGKKEGESVLTASPLKKKKGHRQKA